MSTDEYTRWQGLEIRRPDDVHTSPGGPVPLPWVVEKHTLHADRLFNNDLPVDFPHPVERGDVGDVLAVLALREAIRRDIEYGRGNRIHEALTLGATWAQVAAALDVEPDDARQLLRAYADGQHHLYTGDVARGHARPLGFSHDRHAAAVALCELGDDETAAAGAR